MTSESEREHVIEKLSNSGKDKVKLAVADIDGILRGKIINLEKFRSVVREGFGFCNVIFGWDMNDLCYQDQKNGPKNGPNYTGRETGFPDAQAEIDLNTYREIPWQENIPFFIADLKSSDGAPLPICPRNVLKKVESQAKEMGFNVLCAQEYEWFNFAETSETLYDKGFVDPEPITRGMFGYSILRAFQNDTFFCALFDLLSQFHVPIEGIHTETGPGVYEAAILCSDLLEAADRSVLFKMAVKEIAHIHDITPSFMAKWNSELPGCSGHLHQSLWRDGKNIFYDANEKHNMSEEMKSYIAGMLYCLPHILPLYAPLVNSYKRLVEGMWAPTTLTWGLDNRTTAVRVISGGEKSTRIENRVVGSDMNPYLAMAASLASGLYGIKKKLKLEFPATVGDGYSDLKNGVLPKNLWEAVEQMERSDVAREIFDEPFVKHFCATRRWEWNQFSRSVTNWELKRYFEAV